MLKLLVSGVGSCATQFRQPRQVRKEATVTGPCVRSKIPMPDELILARLIRKARSTSPGTEIPFDQ